jgi:hypothetical protein
MKRSMKRRSTSLAAKFFNDQRVRLIPFGENPEEFGIVDCYEGNGMYLVTLEKKYWNKEDRDGLREVDERQIEATR